MTHPNILIVDENDNPIGDATMQDAQAKGLWHRIARIIVEDSQGNILLQKRSPHVSTFPNAWDHSAAGHVDVGETYDVAAARELKEEVGIDGELEEVGTYQTQAEHDGKILNRFNGVYRFTVRPDTDFHPDEHEVTELRWMSIENIKQFIKDHPDQVTDGLQDVIARYY